MVLAFSLVSDSFSFFLRMSFIDSCFGTAAWVASTYSLYVSLCLLFRCQIRFVVLNDDLFDPPRGTSAWQTLHLAVVLLSLASVKCFQTLDIVSVM